MFEMMINEILKKHDVKDENLAKALAEIFENFYNESQKREMTELRMKALTKGISL